MAFLALKQRFSLKFMQCASIISSETFRKNLFASLNQYGVSMIIAESSKDVNPGIISWGLCQKKLKTDI